MARLIAAALTVALIDTPQAPAAREFVNIVRSPDGHVEFLTWIDDAHRVMYDVRLGGKKLIEPSALGIVVDRVNLTRNAEYNGRSSSSSTRRANDRRNNLRVEFRHRASSTPFALEVRAFDAGVAFRYIVPGSGTRTPDEATEFTLPAGSTVWYHDLDGHYEGIHVRRHVSDIAFGEWAAPPVTFKVPGIGYGSITEGGLTRYSGMALQTDAQGRFHARLAHDHPISYPYYLRYTSADMRRVTRAATVAGPIETPWRIVFAADDLNALVNADLVANVSAPPDPTLFPDGLATPWIKPGRAVWRYLDGGENTYEGLKGFSELAGRLGFEYHVVEGVWQRWTPDQLKAFVEHAASRNVRIWLWKNSLQIREREVRRAFFQQCRDLGVAGVKIDFLDHEAKDVIEYYETLLRDAAEFRLMVNFHGANKGTGLDRTFPNELTREGVYGLEHRGAASWAALNTTLPFTRYLAGPGDYTPVVFGERRKETSWAHQIATAAVFTSPLLVYGAHPQSLLDNPAVGVIKAIPSVWDETVVLPPSEIGELAAFARRSGRDWFVAVLNGPSARTLTLDLAFLPAGRFEAALVRDSAADPAAVVLEQAAISQSDRFSIDLRAGGGFIGRFVAQ